MWASNRPIGYLNQVLGLSSGASGACGASWLLRLGGLMSKLTIRSVSQSVSHWPQKHICNAKNLFLLKNEKNPLLFKIFHLAMPLHCLVILPTSFPSMVTTFKIVNNDLIGKKLTICQKNSKNIHLNYWIPMRWYLKGGSVRPNFSMVTYESITLL